MTESKVLWLTPRGRYALMALIELADSNETNPCPLAHIADVGGISLSYLEQLFTGLRQHEIVKSYRGPGGGYVLARSTNRISISEILIAAEDNNVKNKPKKKPGSGKGNTKSQALWDHAGRVLYSTLANISLQDVIDNKLDLSLLDKIKAA